MFNLLSLIIGVVALILAVVAFLPLLGWANWLIIPLAIVGAVIGMISRSSAGRNLNFFVILVGVIGGTIAYGISGLFLGPIILSVAWALLVHWVEDQNSAATAAFPVEAPTPISPGEDRRAWR